MDTEVFSDSPLVFGSTGSIGRQTLDVLSHLGRSPFALAAGGNASLLAEQIKAFHPRYASIADERAYTFLKPIADACGTTLLAGKQASIELASMREGGTAICAMSGVAGLAPTMAAIKSGHTIALANKETMVCGGHLVTDAANLAGVALLPVDSEHNAIFQSLLAGKHEEVRRLILTCSGGPFFGMSREETENITPAQALRHPNWRMGPKITVDCATLMNKGLELMEAMHLFALPPEKIDIVIHRESVFHSFVEYCDGAIIGEAAHPDMRLAIQYALTYPRRCPSQVPPLSFAKVGKLSFYDPDTEAFPCLRLAREVAGKDDGSPILLNGANEAAVAAFLAGEISFGSIYRTVEAVLDKLSFPAPASLEDIAALDAAARQAAGEYIASHPID